MMRRPLLRNNNEFLGFSLIELMVVIAIIGLCASIAIPSTQTLFIRAKQAERHIILGRMANDLKNYYGTHGGFPCEDYSHHPTRCIGLLNPPCSYPDCYIPKKKMYFNNNALNWRLIGISLERGIYYYYMFCAESLTSGCEPGECTWFSVSAFGDLDGNGIVSLHQIVWHLTDKGKWWREVIYNPNRWEP